MFSVSVRNFDETYIGVPSKDEQAKIAKLLIAIDKRIATQNKIIEKLKSLIKGLNNTNMVLEENLFVSEIFCWNGRNAHERIINMRY